MELKDLKTMHCSRIQREATPLSEGEVNRYLEKVPGWSVVERDGIPRLEKRYKFKDFKEALAFTNRVGGIAEDQDHHPMIATEWGRVTVSWWTHVIRGLHLNDFIMAAKTDELYS